MELCTLFFQIFWIYRKFEYLELHKFNQKLCTLDVQIFWICRKIEYSELRKFYGILCTLYVWNIQIYRKIELCRHIECIELRKSSRKLYTLDVQIVWMCKKFVYLELRKFNGKLYTLYVRIVWMKRHASWSTTRQKVQTGHSVISWLELATQLSHESKPLASSVFKNLTLRIPFSLQYKYPLYPRNAESFQREY